MQPPRGPQDYLGAAASVLWNIVGQTTQDLIKSLWEDRLLDSYFSRGTLSRTWRMLWGWRKTTGQ